MEINYWFARTDVVSSHCRLMTRDFLEGRAVNISFRRINNWNCGELHSLLFRTREMFTRIICNYLTFCRSGSINNKPSS